MQPVYISFTSTPERLPLILPMIESINNQSFKDFTLFLWLCHTYKRSGKSLSTSDLPDFLKNNPLLTVRFCQDYGSNTKLYPLIQEIQDPSALLITADDDTLYPPYWLEGLIQASLKDPSKAYGYRGKILKKRTWRLPFTSMSWKMSPSYAASRTLMPRSKEEEGLVDILTGVWGILYRRSFFDTSYFNLEACPAALHNDDLWANGHLAKRGIPRYCLQLKEGSFQDIPMEKQGIKRLWDSVNNGKGLNDKVLTYFKNDF